MRKFKQDNFNGNGDYGDMFATVWSTGATTTAGNWTAVQTNDSTSPAALEGFSFRVANAGNTDALYGTVGVVTVSLTAAGYAQVQIGGRYATAAVNATIGQDLIIDTNAGRAVAVGNAATNGAAYRIIGRALATSAANVASVDIYPHPMFLN